jgi:hypothetical protein
MNPLASWKEHMLGSCRLHGFTAFLFFLWESFGIMEIKFDVILPLF